MPAYPFGIPQMSLPLAGTAGSPVCHEAGLWRGIAYRRLGENIASGTRMDTVEAGATRGWEHSPGHRGNMLSHDFKEVGIALWREGRKAYWVQLFLTQR